MLPIAKDGSLIFNNVVHMRSWIFRESIKTKTDERNVDMLRMGIEVPTRNLLQRRGGPSNGWVKCTSKVIEWESQISPIPFAIFGVPLVNVSALAEQLTSSFCNYGPILCLLGPSRFFFPGFSKILVLTPGHPNFLLITLRKGNRGIPRPSQIFGR